MEPVEKCLQYMKEKLQEYIVNNVDEKTLKYISFRKGNIDEFLQKMDIQLVKLVYKELLKECSKSIFSDFCNENNVDNDRSLYIKIIEILEADDSFLDFITDRMIQFAEDNRLNPEVNKYLTGEQLSQIEDEIGNKIKSYKNRDVADRDKCFIDIDGTILTGNETHAVLVSEYMKSIGKDELDEKFLRPEQYEMKEIADSFGFGSIEENIWFVEDDEFYGNMDAERIVEDIKNSGYKFDKIYIMDDNNYMFRAAKLK